MEKRNIRDNHDSEKQKYLNVEKRMIFYNSVFKDRQNEKKKKKEY
jgi:hypothetical protein